MMLLPSASPVRCSWGGLLLVGVLLGACSTAQRPGALPEATASRLQALLDQAAAARKSPGMVMAVRMGNATPWVGVTGCQDADCQVKMTPDAVFRIGSITKTFVGATILEQANEGKLSLDDTLEQWLPGVFAHIDGKGITLRQLLNHTSGIENFTDSLAWGVTVYKTPTHPWNAPDELLALADRLRVSNPAVLAPGSRFAYSNTNYVLLGMIAAKAEGLPLTGWRTVVQKRFLDRLGLRHTRMPERGEVELGAPNHGYINFYNLYFDPRKGTSECVPLEPPCKDRDVDITRQDMSSADAAGGMLSTAEDLLTWIQALTQGPLFSEELRRLQQTFSSTCAPGASDCDPRQAVQVGLALFRQPRYGFIGIHGEIFGFNGTIQYLPEKKLTVVILSNRTALDHHSVADVPEDVAAALHPDLVAAPTPFISKGTPHPVLSGW